MIRKVNIKDKHYEENLHIIIGFGAAYGHGL